MMGMMLLMEFGICIVSGLAAYRVGMVGSILICLFGGAVGMVIGMIMGAIRFGSSTESMRQSLIADRNISEAKCKRRLRDAVDATKKECAGFALSAAKSVANRVANRILARHVTGMLEFERREAILTETNEIIDEEILAFRNALVDESEPDEKT